MQKLAENLWIMRFPVKTLGADLGRTTTLIGLRSGELILHSTAPFSAADVTEIAELGQPDAMIEATLFHDTFATSAHKLFPNAKFFAPEDFSKLTWVPTDSLAATPELWRGELDVLRLEGIPKLQEHVFFHSSSRTLIVADLVFNFGPSASAWTRFLFRWVSGIKQYPAMSRLFRAQIREPKAFAGSIARMMQWNFDRVIVGHGDVIESDGKAKLAHALAEHDF
jgi:hypothetical protein